MSFVLGETTPLGIIATGTIIRGHAHPASDIDLWVVHAAPHRRRVQRFFCDVPTEIFINPPHTVRSYFASEQRGGRRVTAHMVATGFVMLDRDPVIETLRAESREWLAQPELLSADDVQRARYVAATLLEDGADVTDVDSTVAALILARAVTQMLEFWLRVHGHPVPRTKALVSEISALEPSLGDLAIQFARAASPEERLALAYRIGDRTIEVRGFFEWDSGPEPV